MNKTKYQPERFDLDTELQQLERGKLAEELRAFGKGSDMPEAAAQRLKTQLYSTIRDSATDAQVPHRASGNWLGRWPFRVGLLRYAVGAGLMLLLIITTAIAAGSLRPRTVSAAELIHRAEKRAGYIVEPGKVRHIVRQVSSRGNLGGRSHTDDFVSEIWLAQGKDHLLISTPIHTRLSDSAPYELSHSQVADEQYFWSYDVASSTVYQSPFAECSFSLDQWLGNKQFLEDALHKDAQLAGTEKVNGFDTQIVEFHKEEAATVRMWIEPETGRIVQSHGIVNTADMQNETIDRLILDEITDLSAAPKDLFTFTPPDGVKVIKQDEPMCSKG
jgi:outer membrane lipoprotein-sorting protein